MSKNTLKLFIGKPTKSGKIIGYKARSFGTVSPEKLNGQKIEEFTVEDGEKAVIVLGASVGESITLYDATNRKAIVTLDHVEDGRYEGESDALNAVLINTFVEFGIKFEVKEADAPKKDSKPPAKKRGGKKITTRTPKKAE